MTEVFQELAEFRQRRAEFHRELTHLLNRTGMDAQLNTPDHVLAAYLTDVLLSFGVAIADRDSWFGFDPQKAFQVEPPGD